MQLEYRSGEMLERQTAIRRLWPLRGYWSILQNSGIRRLLRFLSSAFALERMKKFTIPHANRVSYDTLVRLPLSFSFLFALTVAFPLFLPLSLSLSLSLSLISFSLSPSFFSPFVFFSRFCLFSMHQISFGLLCINYISTACNFGR